jgi:hypothetical protein
MLTGELTSGCIVLRVTLTIFRQEIRSEQEEEESYIRNNFEISDGTNVIHFKNIL